MVQTASAASVGPANPGSKLGGRLFFVTILHGTVLALRVACGMAAWIADLNLLGMLRALSRLSAFVLAFLGESGAMFSLVFHMQMNFCGGATDSIFCAR